MSNIVFANASLYVGDLDRTVNEAQLYALFSQVGTVLSVKICTDQITELSLGYGYVNYQTHEEANHALETLNYTVLNGKPIRIMFSQRDPSLRKSGYANVFIKNLHPEIDNKTLHELFVSFGTVLSCKVATDSNGRSKGFAFVQYQQEEAAQRAIGRLNGMLLNEKPVYVGLFVRRQERYRGNGLQKFKNVYIKNLPDTFTDDNLKEEFEPFGRIISAVVMREEETGKSRGFAFVSFEEEDAASAAVEKLNGRIIDDKLLYVGRAQKKVVREAELRAKFEQERTERREKLQRANLYVKNFDGSFNDEKLKEVFSSFGHITSSKVMLDSEGKSRRSGFVQFSSPEDASRAAHFSKLNSSRAANPNLPVPGYHPGTSNLASQQFYFAQGAPAFIQPRPASFGFQQQLIQGTRPGLAPNFRMPYHFQRQGQPGHRIGQMQQPQCLQMPGDQLYPLVHQIEQEHANTVTGMLLELDQNEVLHLIESPEALQVKLATGLDALDQLPFVVVE